jgi:hypothetical protein
MELQDGDCRYILRGEGINAVYCAARAEKHSAWCGPHRQIVFRPFVPFTERSLTNRRHQLERRVFSKPEMAGASKQQAGAL